MSSSNNNVLVVGTGTIGEPLIGLLVHKAKELGINKVFFTKKTPASKDRAKIRSLIKRGAIFVAEEVLSEDFMNVGMNPDFTLEDTYKGVDVIIDCTPNGNTNKEKIYKEIVPGIRGFIAQGSEKGFGFRYAYGISDSASLKPKDKFRQVVSCNTHNLSVLVDSLGLRPKAGSSRDPEYHIRTKVVIIRRSNDTSQNGKFVPAPEVDVHKDPVYGTHQAEDAASLFRENYGFDLDIFSSTAKVNTQYMHTMNFSITVRDKPTEKQIFAKIEANPRIAISEHRTCNTIFSFGRDHGHYGRILNQTVIPLSTINVRGNEITGWCFTPQDGNSLLSSTAAALSFMYPDYLERMEKLLTPPFVFEEV